MNGILFVASRKALIMIRKNVGAAAEPWDTTSSDLVDPRGVFISNDIYTLHRKEVRNPL